MGAEGTEILFLGLGKDTRKWGFVEQAVSDLPNSLVGISVTLLQKA